jgi:O-antigen ligase
MRSDEKPLGWAELLFLIGTFMLMNDALSPLLSNAARGVRASLTDSNTSRLLGLIAIYGVATLLLVFYRARALRQFLVHPLIIALALLPLATIAWAPDTATVMRRAIAHALTIVFCVFLVDRLSPRQFIATFLLAWCVGGVASLALGVLVPSLAIHSGAMIDGSWMGVYGHKAELGRTAAFAITTALFFAARTPTERAIKIIVLVSFAALAVLAQSRTGWILMGIGVAIWLIAQIALTPRLTPILKMTVAGAAASAAGVIAWTFRDTLLMAMGRDATMSGRQTLWRASFDKAMAEHPLQGVGYQSFWTEQGMNDMLSSIEHWESRPGHGHNGYIDTFLNLGFIGVCILAVFMIITLVNGLRLLSTPRPDRDLAALFALSVLAGVNNIVSTIFWVHSDIGWVIFVCASLYFAMALARAPAAARQRIGSPARA